MLLFPDERLTTRNTHLPHTWIYMYNMHIYWICTLFSLNSKSLLLLCKLCGTIEFSRKSVVVRSKVDRNGVANNVWQAMSKSISNENICHYTNNMATLFSCKCYIQLKLSALTHKKTMWVGKVFMYICIYVCTWTCVVWILLCKCQRQSSRFLSLEFFSLET